MTRSRPIAAEQAVKAGFGHEGNNVVSGTSITYYIS